MLTISKYCMRCPVSPLRPTLQTLPGPGGGWAAAETRQHPVGLDTPSQEQSRTHTCSYNMPSLDSALASFNFVVSDCMAWTARFNHEKKPCFPSIAFCFMRSWVWVLIVYFGFQSDVIFSVSDSQVSMFAAPDQTPEGNSKFMPAHGFYFQYK